MSIENLSRLLDQQPYGYVRESTQYLKVSGLKTEDAKAILGECSAAGWAATAFDETNQDWPADALSDHYEPFRIDITKPEPELDRLILTRVGLENYLRNDCREGHCCRVVGLSNTFASRAASFVPWQVTKRPNLTPTPATKSPMEIVREYGTNRVPTDIRHWLLHPESEKLFNDPVFLVWARLSSAALLLSLPDELEPGTGCLRFKGPPRLSAPGWTSDTDLLAGLGEDGFSHLQLAVDWVFEDAREAQTRHTLLANEIARSGEVSGAIGAWIGQHIEAALQSAKLAHQLHLSNIGVEMIKALQELRKAVAEETAKTTEATRVLIAAIASALAVEIGLVASKVAAPEVVRGIMWVAFAYVVAVAASGFWYIGLQRKVRESWRDKLYRFLPASEYQAMVRDPVKSAERAFYFAAALSTCAVIGMLTTLPPATGALGRPTPSASPASSPTITPMPLLAPSAPPPSVAPSAQPSPVSNPPVLRPAQTPKASSTKRIVR